MQSISHSNFERASVVVCGAGAAGMAAALAAAERGASVLLLEARREIGGTVTHALIHTLGGLYDSAGRLLNGGLAGELVERLRQADGQVRQRQMGRTWVLNVSPGLYADVVAGWLAGEPRIHLLRESRVSRAVCAEGCLDEVEIDGPQGAFRLRPMALVDATGTAEVVRLIDEGLVEDDPRRAAGGWIFTMRGVQPDALAFPHGLGLLRSLRRAATEGLLPAECRHAWIDSGVSDDEVYVKLFVPLRPSDSRPFANAGLSPDADGDVSRQARQTQEALVRFLKTQPGFAQAVVGRTGSLGVRDCGRIRGRYRLTASDVRQGRRFPDGVCRCSWPIEYWDPAEGLALEYLPDDACYEIPLRSLEVSGIGNVWAAGKCLSADREAQASARVVGTCWAMGEAAGAAAATA